jgi:hypothetical protein
MITHLVRVRYLGPTANRGARLKAVWLGRQVTVNRDYVLSSSEQGAQLALGIVNPECPGRHDVIGSHDLPPNHDTAYVISCEL